MSSSDTSGEICSKMLLLRSSDGEDFQVEESAAGVSGTIKHMLEEGVADGAIPLPNVTGATLAKVVEYCNKHAPPAAGRGDQRPEEEEAAASSASEKDLLQTIGKWEEEFMKIDMDTLYDLIQAANYLDVKGLLELTCQRVADMIKGKTPEQIRQTFGIKNDFSPEEEAAVRLENQWDFE